MATAKHEFSMSLNMEKGALLKNLGRKPLIGAPHQFLAYPLLAAESWSEFSKDHKSAQAALT